MTNLYDFLRQLKAQAEKAIPGAAPLANADRIFVTISQADREWLAQYMTDPENLIQFKANKVGEQPDGEPIMAIDFAIAGNGLEIFCLLTEAMLQNFQFADQVLKAAAFYRDHIPGCPDCSRRHFGQDRPDLNWIFSPHKPIE